jgi:hypothetical protein
MLVSMVNATSFIDLQASLRIMALHELHVMIFFSIDDAPVSLWQLAQIKALRCTFIDRMVTVSVDSSVNGIFIIALICFSLVLTTYQDQGQ